MQSQQAITSNNINNNNHKCTSSRPTPQCTGVNRIHRLILMVALTSVSTLGRVYRRSPCNLLSLYHPSSCHSNIWCHRASNNSNQTTRRTAISNRSINHSSSCSNSLHQETIKKMLSLFHQNKVVFRKINRIPTCWVNNHLRVAAHQANNPKITPTLCPINLNSTIQTRIFVSTTRPKVHHSIQTWSSPNPSNIQMKCPHS